MCLCDQSLATPAFLWEKLTQPQFYKDLTRKTAFSEGWSWFKFINLGLALGINLKFYSSVAKGLKLKARAILEANSYVYRSYGRKTNRRGGSLFAPPPSLSPILNRVKAEAVIGRRSSKIVVLWCSFCTLAKALRNACERIHFSSLFISSSSL